MSVYQSIEQKFRLFTPNSSQYLNLLCLTCPKSEEPRFGFLCTIWLIMWHDLTVGCGTRKCQASRIDGLIVVVSGNVVVNVLRTWARFAEAESVRLVRENHFYRNNSPAEFQYIDQGLRYDGGIGGVR
jgi:hypothetical protein